MTSTRKLIATYLSYANVMSTLALFVALGGASYAAISLPRDSVGTAQIRSGAVTAAKIRRHSLVADDFSPGALSKTGAGVTRPTGATGLTGPIGPVGPAGPAGSIGPAGEPSQAIIYYSSYDGGSTSTLSSESTVIDTLEPPAGLWVVHGVIPLRSVSPGAQEIGCGVIEGGTQVDDGYAEIGTTAGAVEYATLTFNVVVRVEGRQEIVAGCRVVAGSGSTKFGTNEGTFPTLSGQSVSLNDIGSFPPPP